LPVRRRRRRTVGCLPGGSATIVRGGAGRPREAASGLRLRVVGRRPVAEVGHGRRRVRGLVAFVPQLIEDPRPHWLEGRVRATAALEGGGGAEHRGPNTGRALGALAGGACGQHSRGGHCCSRFGLGVGTVEPGQRKVGVRGGSSKGRRRPAPAPAGRRGLGCASRQPLHHDAGVRVLGAHHGQRARRYHQQRCTSRAQRRLKSKSRREGSGGAEGLDGAGGRDGLPRASRHARAGR